MKIYFSLLFLIFISACTSVTSFKKYLRDETNFIKVYCYNLKDNNLEESYKYVELRSKREILRVINSFGDEDEVENSCGYSGSIYFYNDSDKLIDDITQFSVFRGCEYIVAIYKNRVFSKKMTPSGISYLRRICR